MFRNYYMSQTGHVSPIKVSATDVAVVVISPESREQVERLLRAYYPGGDYALGTLPDQMQAALRSLIAPPKPEEPLGLGAVVEDADGVRWVRTHATGYPWHAALDPRDLNCTAARKYDDITAVRVLSGGVA